MSKNHIIKLELEVQLATDPRRAVQCLHGFGVHGCQVLGDSGEEIGQISGLLVGGVRCSVRRPDLPNMTFEILPDAIWAAITNYLETTPLDSIPIVGETLEEHYAREERERIAQDNAVQAVDG